jgi:putative addiction module CopG family antidote
MRYADSRKPERAAHSGAVSVLQSRVASGRYQTATAVVREGLRLFEEREHAREAALALDHLIDLRRRMEFTRSRWYRMLRSTVEVESDPELIREADRTRSFLASLGAVATCQ